MLNYYDEIKNDILAALEEEEEYKKIIAEAEDKEDAYYKLEDVLFMDDAITGNASGSYYFSSYKSRKHCYSFFRDVFEALEEYGYEKELKNFKTFVSLVEEGYLNIENMSINYELLNEVDEDEQYFVFYVLDELEGIDFEKLDVITRCHHLSSVLDVVLDDYLD